MPPGLRPESLASCAYLPSTLPRCLTANGCRLTCTGCRGFRQRIFPTVLWRLPTSENGESAAFLVVAACCEPDKRSSALASCERYGLPECVGLRFALAACCEPDRRSTLLLNRSRFERRGGLGSCRTVAACHHQKIVNVPYSNPAESSVQVTDWTTRLPPPSVAACRTVCHSTHRARLPFTNEPPNERRSGMPR